MASGPYFSLIYQGVDISSELDPMTTSISYTDNHHGKIDEIDVTVQDKDGRWKGAWKPEPGDTMTLTIFDGLGGILPCGTFEMDEPDAEGDRGGDRMTMRGLAAPITKPLRTQKSRAFEKQSLKAIVSKVAGENGLSLEGEVESLNFERVSQRRERDLEFLTRLAEETGHYFSVRGTRAIFTSIKSVDGRAAALTVSHLSLGTSLLSYRLKEQTADTYSKAKVSYLDPNKKETVESEETDSQVKTGDVLKIAGERTESPANAKALARSRMHFKNRKRRSGSFSHVGDVRAVAGVTVNMADFGKYSGLYLIDRSTHRMTRGGYTTDVELLDARK
ncbi:phage late control D family protein [Rhizobium herbae]|uniref:Phage protein D n=1 Tax=Rhizobium herbae TaxID=508661 RepID=A0ABS4EVZ1_9HYPH|nr:contractile injection system protein, VgrG/Pvc8 family [Rhizobium herbae]MBP1862136.1 phage protein D [Rhizobium herbae]